MSGRSAYVRKKTQDPVPSRTKSKSSSTASSRDSRSSTSTGEYPYYPAPSAPVGTGVGTTNARFLRFSDSTADMALDASDPNFSRAGWDGYYAHEQSLRTEDVSGIEKSGLRSAIDRKSEDVRNGIARTLKFGKKGRDGKGKGKGKEREDEGSLEAGDEVGDMDVAALGRTRETLCDGAYREYDFDSYDQAQPRHSQMPAHYHQEPHNVYQLSPPEARHQYMPPSQSPRSPRLAGTLHPWDASTPLPSPPPSRALPSLPPHAQRQ